MATCTMPLTRPEEPNVANLPCGKEAAYTFILDGTHEVWVNRCIECMANNILRDDLMINEIASLERLPRNNRQRKEHANG